MALSGIFLPIGDAESSAVEMEEMSVPASPPRLPIPQGLATSSMTHGVTSSVIYRQQLEDEAAASSPRDQKDGVSGRQSPGSGRNLIPLRADHQGFGEDSEDGSGGA